MPNTLLALRMLPKTALTRLGKKSTRKCPMVSDTRTLAADPSRHEGCEVEPLSIELGFN